MGTLLGRGIYTSYKDYNTPLPIPDKETYFTPAHIPCQVSTSKSNILTLHLSVIPLTLVSCPPLLDTSSHTILPCLPASACAESTHDPISYIPLHFRHRRPRGTQTPASPTLHTLVATAYLRHIIKDPVAVPSPVFNAPNSLFSTLFAVHDQGSVSLF